MNTSPSHHWFGRRCPLPSTAQPDDCALASRERPPAAAAATMTPMTSARNVDEGRTGILTELLRRKEDAEPGSARPHETRRDFGCRYPYAGGGRNTGRDLSFDHRRPEN